MSDNKTLSTTAIDDTGSQPPDQKSLDSGSADAGGAPLGKTLSNAGTITKTKLTLLETLGLRDPKPDARPAWDGRNPSWFRSTFFQVTILGICSFLAPGIWVSHVPGTF
ncbi:hypothetical protein BCV70DRAFT_233605 [Testicularia cyperi]|uniref:Uncharacterized protein n=1 Tax=Testicularia cyperi TaxID=1882483 RepID=A0A317XIB4_9BASI|nr:hypothetical protein BCV70DRAFT_233605 [Testicularia cyperi]